MPSDEPSGAVDADFDDAATDAEAQLRKNIAAYPSAIQPGDVSIDLVEGRPLYVRERKGTAVDVFEREAFDLTTYKAHPWLPIGPHDDVFECVFLPTKPSDLPSKKKSQTYSYPRGRLARVAVEWLYDSDTHRHADQTIEMLARVFENTGGPALQAVVNTAVNAYGEEWVDIALEVAGHDPDEYDQDVVVDFADVDPDTGEADTDELSETELRIHAIRALVDSLKNRDTDDAVFEAIAEAVVHDFEPVVGDRVMPHMPERDTEDNSALGDFEDFEGDA